MRVGFGESYLLQTILVVVLAGFSPFGGKGRVASLAIGLILLQILSTSMNAFGFSPYARNLVWGVILILIMVLNRFVGTYRPRLKAVELPPAEPSAEVPVNDASLTRA
jgi:simple sugar transport system permease protein